MARQRIQAKLVLWVIVVLSVVPVFAAGSAAPVKMWEEPVVIPTYEVGPAELNPIFYNGRGYQGAKGPIYPYPILDKLTEQRRDKSYKAVYLENEYIQISVLPEIGGRIFTGLDKTNGYDFFYRQHVIKPALIGMLGAWISGGVEWNIPHHHRASTFMPVDYKMVENADGSKTLWVGELEWRHRMRWLVGLTLRPGKSYLEATVKLFNRTALPHSMLYFANVAAHANPDYQVIFPPGTEYGTQHSKVEFIEWPIALSHYGGIAHNGADVSWWKNHPTPISIFAWNHSDDFFGGYDHGKQAGVAHVADHHVVPGKKFFEFANGPEGQMWDKILTDSDGPYLELMSGAYSDNQPDYSWVQPYEVKTIKQYWYPLRQLGGLKNANLDAAVNLEVTPQNQIRFALNATSEFNDARVVLRTEDKVLFEETIQISPQKPFQKEIATPAGLKAEDLKVTLYAADGRELIGYQPVKPKHSPMPKPVTPPPDPQKIKTNEELYLTGLRLEQFYNPAREPYPYYEEALRRDPGDARTNTAIAILYCKRGMYQEAEQHLRKALERLTHNYTSPKDGEAFYYLGVALQAQGRLEEADTAFHEAGWSLAWYAASHVALAEDACRLGQWDKALVYIDRAIANNAANTKALNIKLALLRHLNRWDEVEALAARVQSLDPLDFWSGNELYLTRTKQGQTEEARQVLSRLQTLMRGAVQSYLEMAVDYGRCGLWDDAIAVLDRYVAGSPDPARIYPMAHYYLGYYHQQKGALPIALEHYRKASQMPSDYCFPFRLESIGVLEAAMKQNPQDARAPYYLGNLLFDLQPQKAIAFWEQARGLDGSFAIVHRNLGLAYAQTEKNTKKAVASLEKAVACNPKDPKLYAELDSLRETAGLAPQKRLELLEKNHEVVAQRDDALTREIVLLVQVGQYDKAIQLLDNHHFHLWEGAEHSVHDVYVDAHLLRGDRRFKAKQYAEALKDYEAALEYPDRFEAGKPYKSAGRIPQVAYLIGTAYESLGQSSKAQSHYKESVASPQSRSELAYYQGLAYRKLGQEAKAQGIFEGLIEAGRKRLDGGSAEEFYAKFGTRQSEAVRQARSHYLAGLGLLGKNQKEEARQEFQKAVQLDVNQLGAQTMLASLQ